MKAGVSSLPHMVVPAMNDNAAKGFAHKRDHKRILWTIERMKRLVTERIAGEQFALKEAIL